MAHEDAAADEAVLGIDQTAEVGATKVSFDVSNRFRRAGIGTGAIELRAFIQN